MLYNNDIFSKVSNLKILSDSLLNKDMKPVLSHVFYGMNTIHNSGSVLPIKRSC